MTKNYIQSERFMRYVDFISLWGDFFERLFAGKEKRDYLDNVPRYCRQCELLGICRDKNNHWKCHNGCMALRAEQRRYGGKWKLFYDALKIYDRIPEEEQQCRNQTQRVLSGDVLKIILYKIKSRGIWNSNSAGCVFVSSIEWKSFLKLWKTAGNSLRCQL